MSLIYCYNQHHHHRFFHLRTCRFVQFLRAYFFWKLMVVSFLLFDFVIIDTFAASVDIKHTHHGNLLTNISVTTSTSDCDSFSQGNLM